MGGSSGEQLPPCPRPCPALPPLKEISRAAHELDKYCALSLEFMNLLQNFHLGVIEYLCHGRRAVPLQTFTTGHSKRKLSTVMALSTILRNPPLKLPNSIK